MSSIFKAVKISHLETFLGKTLLLPPIAPTESASKLFRDRQYLIWLPFHVLRHLENVRGIAERRVGDLAPAEGEGDGRAWNF